jgi:hypothetical protein
MLEMIARQILLSTITAEFSEHLVLLKADRRG